VAVEEHVYLACRVPEKQCGLQEVEQGLDAPVSPGNARAEGGVAIVSNSFRRGLW